MDGGGQATSGFIPQSRPPGSGPSKKNSCLLQRLQEFLNRALDPLPGADAQRGAAHAQAMLLGLGRHTVTAALTTQGRQHRDWSADYRVYSAGRLKADLLLGAVLERALASQPDGSRIWLALDDSTPRKSGRKIPLSAWRRDPLSPPFAINFQWGQRVLQTSVLWPEARGGARALPVAWDILLNRPSKKQQAQWEPATVREAQRQANVNEAAVRQCTGLAQQIARRVVVAVDGRFANKTFLRRLPAFWSAVARIRKDTRLFHPPPAQPAHPGRPGFYGPAAPRPEQLRQDPDHPWQRVRVHAAGRDHDMKIKTLGPLRSTLTGSADGRLIIIAPLGYRLHAGAKLLYRQPAYLWITDPQLSLQEAVQGYVWRWEEEVNFRDEKTLLGVGQAQVRHPQSVARVPAWQVAAYSALLCCAQSLGQDGIPPLPRPKWQGKQPPRRPSTATLINQLRYDAWASAISPDSLRGFWSQTHPDQKPTQSPTSLPAAIFFTTG